MSSQPDSRYQARGVSAAKADVHAAIADHDQGLYPGAFCKILPDVLTADAAHCVLMHADTAGTKAALAHLADREHFGEDVWAGLAQDALVMNLDDCGCVGALGPFLISNTIGRNAHLVSGEAIKQVIDGYRQVCDLLTEEGIPCHLAGGETADVGDIVRTIDVGCTVTARLPRHQVIDASDMRMGDVIVGFASNGRARWEDRPNSGIGSNGLTSARHDALHHRYAKKYPETYAPETPKKMVYAGSYTLGDRLPGDQHFSVGGALLSPTRTYLPLIKAILDELPRDEIHGLIHCSGGGQAKIGKFGHIGDGGRGNRYVKDALPEAPPVFQMLREASGTSWQEAYTVWNMGVRLEAVIPEARADSLLRIAQHCGIKAWVTGRVEANDGPGHAVELRTPHGTFTY